MNRLWTFIGTALFWLSWPALWLILHRSERTRVLVQHDGRILAVKGWVTSGKWGLPGGGLHRGENPTAGVLRELREETGLQLRTDQLIPLGTKPYREQGIGFTCHYFAATLTELPPTRKQALEITDLRWLDPGELTARAAKNDVLTALEVTA